VGHFYVGVGGSGAKLMNTLIHLTAAGLLSVNGDSQSLWGYLVDPDKSNGSIEDCKNVLRLYLGCRKAQYGDKAAFFRNDVQLNGPWAPVDDDRVTMNAVFGYDGMRETNGDDADLMELLYSEEERKMPTGQGFRGRPAIGAAVFNHTVNFDRAPMWQGLINSAEAAHAYGAVSVILAGSVFGGSGAAGVPTISRLLKDRLQRNINDVRMGMVLFLPYFTYDKVKDEKLQADPNSFPVAAAEALKYYEEGHFFDICNSIYVIGDSPPAKMPVSAVGRDQQRNPPHYVELIAGLGTLSFLTMDWRGTPDPHQQRTVSLASRQDGSSLTWDDLPLPGHPDPRLDLFRQFILFAVVYHYVVFPFVGTCKDGKHPLTDLLGDTRWDVAWDQLEAVDNYLVSFLEWLLDICTPQRQGAGAFSSHLVDVNVFGIAGEKRWRLQDVASFKDDRLPLLFVDMPEYRKPSLRRIFWAATQAVNDQNIDGAGMLVRAVYEACKLT
jgi:hypothetical protein